MRVDFLAVFSHGKASVPDMSGVDASRFFLFPRVVADFCLRHEVIFAESLISRFLEFSEVR